MIERISDREKVDALKELGVAMEITGDVMTLTFETGFREDWLAVSPMMLECDAWQSYEAMHFAGRAWIKCEAIV
jgi:hypothetical protein